MQPVQLRFGFNAPTAPLHLALNLIGLQVNVTSNDQQLAWSYLTAAGTQAALKDDGTLRFAAAHIATLADLPEQVTVTGDQHLRSLLELIEQPSTEKQPAELVTDMRGSLWLNWFDGQNTHRVPVPAPTARALLAADLPFIASPAAFDTLKAVTQLPVLLGRASVVADGYIEIATSKPQMVELAPLPGLFRIDETRFAIPLAYASSIDQVEGFSWDDEPPTLDQAPDTLPPLPFALSHHSKADLTSLVRALASYRTQAVVWDSGLGRRIFVLAALEALEAYPALIVCPAANLWAWQRHLDLFGRSTSLGDAGADAQLVTYEQLAEQNLETDAQTIIFDGLGDPGLLTEPIRRGLQRLNMLTDAYRIALSSSWPSAPEAVIKIMSVLRPAEFVPGTSVRLRYPGDAHARLRAHVRAYITARPHDAPDNDRTPFRRSKVRHLEPTPAQTAALTRIAARSPQPSPARLADEIEVLSAGPAMHLSPKIAHATSLATDALHAGRRVAILTRVPRAAALLSGMIRVPDRRTLEAANIQPGPAPEHQLLIVRYDRDLPDLHAYDEVVVLDQPWNWEVLDAAIGSPAQDDGPRNVTVLHLRGTLDDRLATAAAARRQSTQATSGPPDAQELAELLR